MNEHDERILLIENDTEISQQIAEQSLKPQGYLVDVYESGATVIQEIAPILTDISPDIIIMDLNLPGLSCKDLMVAMASCGVNVPIVVIANKGQEAEILQTFRLGAVDFLFRPIHETEVINVIENTLNKQRVHKELDLNSQKLDQTKAAMERQQADFSAIFSFIKLVWSAADPGLVAERIATLAMLLTEADSTWVLTSDANQPVFILRACQNVPKEMETGLNLPYEDDLSTLTALSGQSISIHGEALKRLAGLEWIGAALTVPVVQNDKVCAIITTARNEAQPFNASQQAMLELAAEFFWILWEYSGQYHRMEQSLVYLKQANIHASLESDLKQDILHQASLEIRKPIKMLMENVDALLGDTEHKLNREQFTTLNDIQEEAEILMDITDSMLIGRRDEAESLLEQTDLNEAVRYVINHVWPIAQMGRIMINLELPSQPTMIKVYPPQITKVIEGLLSNALKYSPTNGEVLIRIDQNEHDTVLTVKDQGDGIDDNLAARIFEINSSVFGQSARRFGGIGISLATVKEIISAYKGQIWIENIQGTGFTISFSLPRA